MIHLNLLSINTHNSDICIYGRITLILLLSLIYSLSALMMEIKDEPLEEDQNFAGASTQ